MSEVKDCELFLESMFELNLSFTVIVWSDPAY